MVKAADGTSGTRGIGAWRGTLLLLAGFAAIANACGGRTVWVEETGEAGDSGSGGVSGTAGDSGGGYAGDNGGGGYGGTSGYGGSYGGVGGVNITGGYGGDFGGGGFGGTAGYSGSAGTYGGFAGSVGGKGGFAGTGAIGGTAGMAGCGAASGSGGGGSPGLSKSCSYFCSRYPQSCPSDWSDPGECYAECQSGYGLGYWCNYALSDFLICMGTALNPGASCMVGTDGQCYGPGCTADAINQCYPQYQGLLDCIASPRPLPPCPPPPPRPLPPNCGQLSYGGPDYCSRETFCPAQNYMTQCYPQYDVNQTWYCECYMNGVYVNATTTDYYPDPCQAGAALCGFY